MPLDDECEMYQRYEDGYAFESKAELHAVMNVDARFWRCKPSDGDVGEFKIVKEKEM